MTFATNIVTDKSSMQNNVTKVVPRRLVFKTCRSITRRCPVAMLLRLDFNENTFAPSPKVLERLRQITAEGLTKYPEREGVERIAAAHFALQADQVLLTNGVDEAMWDKPNRPTNSGILGLFGTEVNTKNTATLVLRSCRLLDPSAQGRFEEPPERCVRDPPAKCRCEAHRLATLPLLACHARTGTTRRSPALVYAARAGGRPYPCSRATRGRPYAARPRPCLCGARGRATPPLSTRRARACNPAFAYAARAGGQPRLRFRAAHARATQPCLRAARGRAVPPSLTRRASCRLSPDSRAAVHGIPCTRVGSPQVRRYAKGAETSERGQAPRAGPHRRRGRRLDSTPR